MVWRYFLSISLAAAGILLIRNVSGNQIMLAVSVTAGTLKRKRRVLNTFGINSHLQDINMIYSTKDLNVHPGSHNLMKSHMINDSQLYLGFRQSDNPADYNKSTVA